MTTRPTEDLKAVDRRAALHTERCSAARADQAVWDARWPNHCRDCGGAGVVSYRYDPSASGVSLSPGSMMDYDPCDCVTERGVCPRCAGRWPGPPTYVPRYRLARWLDADLIGDLHDAERCVRQAWVGLVRRAHGPRYGGYAERRLRAISPGYRLVGHIGILVGALADRLWPGLLDGENEPACGWCGWCQGGARDDVRPAWECYCAESEAGEGRRCDRCLLVFTDQHPAVTVRPWGIGPGVRVHAICLYPDEELYAAATPAQVPAAP